MKAYIVTEDYEGNGGVIFAKTPIEARRWGADEFNDGELAGMHVSRAPGLDQYHGTGVPARVMVEMGWWFECYNCGERIDEGNMEDRGKRLDGIIGTQHSAVYCDAACRDDHLARSAREKAVGDEFLEMLRSLVVRRFGPVEFVDGPFKEHMFAQEQAGVVLIRDACVSFNFPGQTLAPASLHYTPGYDTKISRPEFTCCAGDKDAFEAFAAVAIMVGGGPAGAENDDTRA